MEKWLQDINILVYLTHNEYKIVVAGTSIRTLKGKIYKELTANGSKSYVSYLDKLLDELNIAYHHSIGKKPTDADHLPFPRNLS